MKYRNILNEDIFSKIEIKYEENKFLEGSF